MYRNKKDVDKYVESLTSKLSVKEFNSRAYSVARLYYDVNDYANCRKYVEQYISHKNNNAAAHKLLGQALQKMGHHEKALEQYKLSLDIDPTQTSLILDICELLADDEVSIELGRAKYWCEKAEATFPRNPVTFRLRERIITNADPDPSALIKLLKSELEIRPKDATLHVRLLKHYLLQNKYSEAIEHSYNIEFDASTFQSNYTWYDTLCEILKHNSHDEKSWLYQLLVLTVRERLCLLSLTETPNGTSKSLVESNELLHEYDQALSAVSKTGAPSGCSDFHAALLQHHYGQFALHAATFLLKKAKKDQISWKEGIKLAAPLMLLAWQVVPLDTNVKWLKNAPNKQEAAVKRWFYEGSYRCSQSGHYLVSSALDKNQTLLNQISQTCSEAHWKDKLYEKLFTHRDILSKIKSSYFICNNSVKLTMRLPRRTEVEAYDIDAQRLYPNSLHYFVWMLIDYKNLADFKCNLFDMLTPKSHKYVNCGPETLDKLDILAYLYCAAISSKQKKYQQKFYSSPDKPIVLPAIITDLLCTLPQIKWWDCAYKFSQNELGFDLTDIRVTLTHGIEVVRCIDSHGLDPELLCILGRTFKEHGKSCKNLDEKNNYEQRAALYYNAAIPLLEKIKCNLAIKIPDKRLFDYTNELQNKEINLLLEESKIFVAVKYMVDGEYEKALETLGNLKTPQALFYLSQIYKNMAVDEYSVYKDTNPDAKTKYAVLLSKAKTFAYKSLHKLKEIQEDRKSPLFCDTQDLIEEIENLLSKGDLDLSSNNIHDDGKYSSDETISTIGNTDHTAPSAFRNISSTPKRMNSNHRIATSLSNITASHSSNTNVDAKALERIETDIKSLQKRDSTICDFMEQTKHWFEDNRNLIINTINSNITDQFKSLKLSVDQVKIQIDECKNECKDVGELKKQVAELKKEVNNLKKVSSTPNMSESDVYNTEEEYRTSDSLSNFGPHMPYNPSQMLSPFGQRLVPPFPVPPNPYQQLYAQNWGNMYNQYNQFAQPPAVPGASPIFDPSRAPINYPGIFPTPEQLYAAELAQLLPNTVPPVPPVPAAVVPAVPPGPLSMPPPVVASSSSIPSKSVPSVVSKESSRALPVNVVITSSDPLPSITSTTTAPILSVTIPPKHIKGISHNYQITMPQTSTTAPSLFNIGMSQKSLTTEKPFDTWNQSQNLNISQTLDTSQQSNNFNSNNSFSFRYTTSGDSAVESPNRSLNKSRTLSEKSNTSVENYDPCPDFKPIIPLPAEVKITTGEEDELVIFCARAKLFRFSDKQWKERGLGEMKLLKHKITGKVRVLMRREQIHKICANHIITPEMEIKPRKDDAKVYYWVANDFAEENVVLEQFSIRFKTPEIARNFYDLFEKARLEAKPSNKVLTTEPPKVASEIATVDDKSTKKTVVGGFTFTGTPTFKAVKDDTPAETRATPTSKVNIFENLTLKTTTGISPFSNLISTLSGQSNNEIIKTEPQNDESSGKLNLSDTVEEYEPNIEFKPVVPLPALVESKTGEEDELVLFEHRAKLLRFESNSKEWKERGLGNIKLLVHKDNNQKLRLLMRREQVMKVCCNHAVTKDMVFQKMPKMEKAVTWCAKDFSEGQLVSETFCLRFKTVLSCDEFLASIKLAQSKLTDDLKSNVSEELNKIKPGKTGSGFGDKFKPKTGTWECEICCIRNEATAENCVACNSSKDPNTTNKETKSIFDGTSKFSFGIPGQTQASIESSKNNTNVDILTQTNKNEKQISFEKNKSSDTKPSIAASGWGDKFKPKSGTWECKQCYIRNEGSHELCGACNSPKDLNAPKKESNSVLDGSSKFSFGIPGQTQANIQKDKNDSDTTSTTTAGKFSFGIPQVEINKPVNNATSIFDGTGSHQFSFGSPDAVEAISGTKYTGVIFATPPKVDQQISTPLNVTLKNNDDATVKVGLLPTPKESENRFGGQESKPFEFVFKPKTPPAKGKSPIKSPRSDKCDDSDEHEYASEDEGHHIHFNPVIPMPDKVEVVTGEENEDELYGHRAKLYRFIKGEWKERGIGVVKILKHKETGKLRVVMRREQVLKICLNHALTNDITYTAKDSKSWLFVANDFSEGQIELQHFCLRFKTKEIANDFKEAIDKAKSGKSDVTPVMKQDSDEVVFVHEIQATSEEKVLAKKLMLPENFFTYTKKDPCQGCRGCENDEDTHRATESCNASSPETSQANLSVFNSPANSMYGTPSNQMKTIDNSMFRTPLESLGSNTTLTPTFGLNNKITDKNDKENVFATKSSAKTSTLSNSTISDNQTPVSTKGPLLSAPKLSSVLSKSNENTEVKSLFGTSLAKPSFSFGNSGEQTVFGNGVAEKSSIFGFNQDSKPGVSTNLFGMTATSSSKSIFSKENTENKTEIKSIFGSNSEQKSDNLFSSNAQGSFFGPASMTQQESQPANLFASAVNSMFGSKASTPAVPSESKEEKEDSQPETPFKVDNSLSFAALKSSGPDAFTAQKKEDFTWEGAGQQLFGGVAKKAGDDDKGANESGEQADDGDTTEEYDPHYEPIVPLPDKIVVTTGEEDEEKLFSERCKLYRYDEKTKEWKERGVGELKILHHAERKTFRLLLRREQVHKVVLNTLIFMDMELLPMKNTETAFTWPARNFAESVEGDQEMLAVRFKTVKLAASFKDKVVECTRILQAQAAQAIREQPDVKTAQPKIAPLRLPKNVNESTRVDLSVQPPQPTREQAEVNTTQPEVAPLRLPKIVDESARVDLSVPKFGISPQQQLGSSSQNAFTGIFSGAKTQSIFGTTQLPFGTGTNPLSFGSGTNPLFGSGTNPLFGSGTNPLFGSGTNPSPFGNSVSSRTAPFVSSKPEEQPQHNEHESENEGEDEDDYDGDEDYQEGYYEEDESVPYIICVGEALVQQGDEMMRCPQSHVQVLYDQEMYSPKIIVTDENTGEILADMLIYTETEFQLSGNSCTWSGTDYTSNNPIEKTVTIHFADSETTMRFFESCEASKTSTYTSVDPES